MPLTILLALAAGAPLDSCHVETLIKGMKVIVYQGDRKCVTFNTPQEFNGVWLNEFEGSEFIDDVPPGDLKGRTWLSMDDQSILPTGFIKLYGHAYRVRFKGRRASELRSGKLDGYGHMGLSQSLVLVDEVLGMEDLGPVNHSR